MTCRECLHWDKCFKKNGTRYYGEDSACNNVEKLCEWYIQKAEQLKWIPVTERLPEKGTTALVCTDRGGVLLAHWYGNKWGGGYSAKHITYWMPLPQPPKEGE